MITVWMLMSTINPQLTSGKVVLNSTKHVHAIGTYSADSDCKHRLSQLQKEATNYKFVAYCMKTTKKKPNDRITNK